MTIDLNADLAESFGRWRLGDDAAMLPLVTSANLACGFHAGDPATLVRTCADAVRAGVSIGAQVSYRDLAGFGRRFIEVAPADLYADVLYQIAALDGIARSVGGRVGYVKPHGALYNAVVHHEQQAGAVARAVVAASHTHPLPVLGLPGSQLLRAAEAAGLPTVPEAFVDRAYTPAGTLVSRGEPDAVLTDPAQVADRAVRMAREHEVVAVDGTVLPARAASLCVHGDSPDAVSLARAVHDALIAAGIQLRPFVAPA